MDWHLALVPSGVLRFSFRFPEVQTAARGMGPRMVGPEVQLTGITRGENKGSGETRFHAQLDRR